MQTSYSSAMDVGFAGMKADIGVGYVESMIAVEQIGFGLAMMKNIGEDKRCRLPVANQVVVTDDAGTYTAGNYVVTINGHTITVAYDTDKNTTLTAVATALQALSYISTAVYASSPHTITVVATSNVNLDLAVDITGITGNMTISSVVHTCTETFHSISLAAQHFEQLSGPIIYDKATITFTGDALNTSDTVTVTLNGVTLSTITYATSEAVTLELIANLIAAQPGIYSALVSARVITILNNEGLPLTVNSVVVVDDSAGTSAATIARLTQNLRQIGKVWHRAADTVNALRRGRVYVAVEDAVTSDSAVYFRHKDSGTNLRGAFRGSASAGYCTLLSVARFVTSAAAGAVAQVEISLP